ncbi:amidase family protein [Natrialbaceae archaeon A-CW3]
MIDVSHNVTRPSLASTHFGQWNQLLSTQHRSCHDNRSRHSSRSPGGYRTNLLVGIRPTRGLCSRTGIVPLSGTQDTAGPITRTVEDAARTLEVIAGYDPEDQVTSRGARQPPAEGYVDVLDADALDGARIGVARQFFGLQGDEGATEADAEAVTIVLEDAIESMAAVGATVIDPVDVVDIDHLKSARVLRYEFARDFDAYLSELGDAAPHDSLAEVVGTGKIAPSIESRFDESDIFGVDPNTVDRDAGYLRRLVRRERLTETTLSTLVEHDLDALLYPPSTIPPVRFPDHQPFDEMNCELSAHTGLPAVVVPAGFTADGLPVGLELLGGPFDEPDLLTLAYAFEQTTTHRRPSDQFGELDRHD